eukprot:Gregarina_sp_Poly_1__4759@NODE_253_length_10628_cov_50_063252_g221_i0_p4_GENE_NODE_253_length_10628_cov_50_063252_g221_i0NODE_253_length_10628_cov_50_063252_g221_i0_p4_ORF_typecomplete_len264_score29_66Acetyltransf_3/PF13302_7/4_8e13Acetyltransf_10/PF13673_7/3e03Acetyltransf_10/PF13673_7/0_088Acetyltransf_10/PF13673_7/3_4e03GNAT_acetyltran/PF12746_7/87GNAT_acetyltran/PF12746_7/2FR47/PF08445_10/1_9_NODE_253_length_10628_cov_50_063252_g221_i07871578
MTQGFVCPTRALENDRVKLIPLSKEAGHGRVLFEAIKHHQQIFEYLLFGPFARLEAFIEDFCYKRIWSVPSGTQWLVIDKTSKKAPNTTWLDEEGAVAGTLGLLNTVIEHAKTEIGRVLIVPEFQRTHVTSNAVGLLMHYVLDLPKSDHTGLDYVGSVPLYGGLGMRRCQWQTIFGNAASARTAERMGFVREGVLRWDRIVPLNVTDENVKANNGGPCRYNDPYGAQPGRDSIMFSVCWDEWEGLSDGKGVRGHVDRIMGRRK